MSAVSKKFFQGKNTPRIAQSILGKVLMRRYHGKTRAYVITEVEAYHGPRDKASHAHRRKTLRNTPMFGDAGCWYVYFVYGAHWMINIVTGPKGYPAAILIRGVVQHHPSALFFQCTDIFLPASPKRKRGELKNSSCSLQSSSQGASKTMPRFGVAHQKYIYLNGPGKLTRALKIDKKFNGKRASKKTGLWIEDWGINVPPRAISTTPRIGVSYAKEWTQKPYRFVLKTTSLSF